MHFLSIEDLSKEQIEKILSIADDLESGEIEFALKEHSVAVLLFEKPSTRTRVSFEVAIAQLHGHSIYVDAKTTQLSRGETWADTAKVLSSYVDFIIARLYKHSDILEIAKNSTVPVINALTDLEHPTQAVSDLYTIKQAKGRLKGLKLAFIGDIASNTVNSLMLAGVKMGMEIHLIGPKNYAPNEIYLTKAMEYGIVRMYDDIEEGIGDVDAVYTDTFVSMGQENEMEERKRIFAPYQLNSGVLKLARKDVIVMHCLPAHRGEEITEDVLEGPNSVVFKQAKNKLIVEKAIMLYIVGGEL
jgi:ornithine carbamoyltransferase